MPCTFPGLDSNPVPWFRFVECVAVEQIVRFFQGIINSIVAGFELLAGWIENALLNIVRGFVTAIAWIGAALYGFFQAATSGTGLLSPLLVFVGVLAAAFVMYTIVVLGKFLGERLIERF